MCVLFSDSKKLSIVSESLHCPTFSVTYVKNVKFEQINGHGTFRNGQAKVLQKFFAKSVGTLY